MCSFDLQKSPVVSRAVIFLELAHFVHRCNKGQWPEWIRSGVPGSCAPLSVPCPHHVVVRSAFAISEGPGRLPRSHGFPWGDFGGLRHPPRSLRLWYYALMTNISTRISQHQLSFPTHDTAVGQVPFGYATLLWLENPVVRLYRLPLLIHQPLIPGFSFRQTSIPSILPCCCPDLEPLEPILHSLDYGPGSGGYKDGRGHGDGDKMSQYLLAGKRLFCPGGQTILSGGGGERDEELYPPLAHSTKPAQS